MSKSNHTKAFIRKGEVFFLNGALIRAHDSVNVEIMISDTFLLPSQIVSEDTAVSHLKKAYYFIQQMLIEPGFRNQWQNRLDDSLTSLPTETKNIIQEAVKANELQKLLSMIRHETKVDARPLN
ncbi:flagellar biosynthesis repressor FlbT [Methylorubrum extorquens]|uniref:Flagellar biosynthesis repressor FlbT n=1 Tax=Methylorubrum extorquens (strain CM4 / NCIMB 13688) TaxID=440085 RepID=B7L3P7_METC4|nr:flagellar biosynthesis repressor FlbT [Methylorubrum extorquens CM4]